MLYVHNIRLVYELQCSFSLFLFLSRLCICAILPMRRPSFEVYVYILN